MKSPRNQGCPLAALFVLVGFCAILAALPAAVAHSESGKQIGGNEFTGMMIGGGLLTAILGAVVGGVRHHRHLHGAMFGGLAGFAVGMSIGPLHLAPSSVLPRLLITTVGGSLMLIFLGVAVRSTPRKSKPAESNSTGPDDPPLDNRPDSPDTTG